MIHRRRNRRHTVQTTGEPALASAPLRHTARRGVGIVATKKKAHQNRGAREIQSSRWHFLNLRKHTSSTIFPAFRDAKPIELSGFCNNGVKPFGVLRQPLSAVDPMEQNPLPPTLSP